MRPPAARRRIYHYGLFAEALCRLALRLKGYRILAARCRTPLGEIDIVAWRGHTIALVEVKARRDHATAAEALQPRQRERLERAAQYLLSKQPDWAQDTLRFDLMLVTPWRWPRHIPNAWEAAA